MNIKQAKQIPIEAVLRAMQAEEKKAKPDRSEIWYKSPWRAEETASFKIDTVKNLYFDHGEGEGGDIIKLVCRHTGKPVKEALQWLNGFSAAILPEIKTKPSSPRKSTGNSIASPGNRLLKEKTLTNGTLCKYITDRGLTLDLVRKHCREISFKAESGKGGLMYGIGMQNDRKGWEVRAAAGNFKTVVGNKALTSIAAPAPGEIKTLHVFEGWPDFLTMEQMRPRAEDAAVLILNSASMAGEGIEKIKKSERLKNVERILCWFDNDETGKRILMQFADELHELAEVGDMSPNYDGFKDLNEYWTKSPEARKQKGGVKIFDSSASTTIANKGQNKYHAGKPTI